MIFTTKNKELAIFGNTIDDIRNKIEKFNELRKKGNLLGENGAFASLFSGKKLNNIIAPETLKQFEEFKEKFNNSSLSAEALAEHMENVDQRIIDYAKTCKNGEMTTEGFKASVDTMSFSAKAATVATKALAMVGNMLIGLVISKLISGFIELTKVSDDVAKKAQEVGSSFKNTGSDIDSYRTKIEELYQTINNSDSSIEDVTNARKNLLSVQDELFEKFGSEKEIVDLVTDAIDGQSDALDKLIEKQWKAAKNEFNDESFVNNLGNFFQGYSDNIDRMENEYGNYTAKIDMDLFSGFLGKNKDKLEDFEETLRKTFGATTEFDDSGNIFLEISGNATDVYNKLLAIQDLSEDFDFTNGFEKHLTKLTNAAEDASDKYKDFWDEYILNEKVLKNNNYADSFKEITEAYKDYKNAFSEGNEEEINNTIENYSNILSQSLSNIDDDYVIDYFKNMYPEMQSLIDSWTFKTKILPEIDMSGLQGKSVSDIAVMRTAKGLQEGEETLNSIIDSAIEYGVILDNSSKEVDKLIDLLIEWGIVQDNLTSNTEASPQLFSSFDGTEIGERLQYINSQFKAGEISCKEYFDALRTEISNVDFSNYTNSLEEANAASAQFFVDSTQQAASGLSDLINKFDSGSISVSEYLEGYLSIANTLSTLTDELQENSASWDQNGSAMSDATSGMLDNTQSALDNAISTIQSYQDSIYSLEQLMTGAVEAGTDEFAAHTQVIAEDLANIVATGGQMADEVANTLGTTTSEIANSMSENVSNQSFAAQVIAANTNTAIGDMANSIGQLFDTLGNAISNFKVDISFGIKSISMQDVDMGLLGTHKLPKIDFSLEASGDSLSAIGSAISSFGKSVASNMAPQMIELPDFNLDVDSYTPDAGVLDNYNKKLNDMKNAQKGAGKAAKDTNDALKEQKEALEAEKEALQEQKEAAEEALQAQIDGIDDVIKGKEKEIDLLDDEIDKIKEASEARKRDIELQKAQYDLERMQNQRPKLVNYMPDTIVI